MAREIKIDKTGVRADLYLAAALPELSRSVLKRQFDRGLVTVSGHKIKPSWLVQAGKIIVVEMPRIPHKSPVPQDILLDIVYEDDYLIAVNKPTGMVVHPDQNYREQTLVNALLYHTKLAAGNDPARPGIVHRIDKDTTGLVLAVKNDDVQRQLIQMLRRREIVRQYEALVHGKVLARTGDITAPLGRDPKNRQRMAVLAQGKPAVSHFETKKTSDKASLLTVLLETGRTHQIRVHLQYIGHPVIGDPVYATGFTDFGLESQMLHAGRLAFVHPVTGRELNLTCPVPDLFNATKERLL